MLAELDCEVVGPVARLAKALEMAQRQALDVALLDVNLGGQEICPVAEALAAREIPFVFVSGYGGALYTRRIAIAQPCRSRSGGTICESCSRRFAPRDRDLNIRPMSSPLSRSLRGDLRSDRSVRVLYAPPAMFLPSLFPSRAVIPVRRHSSLHGSGGGGAPGPI